MLKAELKSGEEGAWLNSRGATSGTAELIRDAAGKFKARRIELPSFVSSRVRAIYTSAGLSKGAADLVIWNRTSQAVRFVEVKCPHWDKPSMEQLEFLRVAAASDCPVSIAEWEFDG